MEFRHFGSIEVYGVGARIDGPPFRKWEFWQFGSGSLEVGAGARRKARPPRSCHQLSHPSL